MPRMTQSAQLNDTRKTRLFGEAQFYQSSYQRRTVLTYFAHRNSRYFSALSRPLQRIRSGSYRYPTKHKSFSLHQLKVLKDLFLVVQFLTSGYSGVNGRTRAFNVNSRSMAS